MAPYHVMLVILPLIVRASEYNRSYVMGPCEEGRILVGGVNETRKEFISAMGFYIRQAETYNNRSVYEQEDGRHFLYYSPHPVLGGNWIIGNEIGNNAGAVIAAQSATREPQYVTEKWNLRIGEEEWVPEVMLKVMCAPGSVIACTSGKLEIGGIGAHHEHIHGEAMGTYMLLPSTYQNRPIYRKLGGKDFLFYRSGFWMLGPVVGQASGRMFLHDYAFRPELAMHTWIVFARGSLVQDHGIKITCQGNNIASTVLADDTRTGAAISRPCEEARCENNATCREKSEVEYLCVCAAGYFGSHCEQKLECGKAPKVRQGNAVVVTGGSFLDLAFYTCNHPTPGFMDVVSVCGPRGRWEHIPRCEPFHMGPSFTRPGFGLIPMSLKEVTEANKHK